MQSAVVVRSSTSTALRVAASKYCGFSIGPSGDGTTMGQIFDGRRAVVIPPLTKDVN